jgi:hypothetical protein
VRGEDIGEDDLQRMRGSPGAGRVAERGRERGRGEGEGGGGEREHARARERGRESERASEREGSFIDNHEVTEGR